MYFQSDGSFSDISLAHFLVFFRISVFSMDDYFLISIGIQQKLVMVPMGIIFMRALNLDILVQNGKAQNVMSFYDIFCHSDHPKMQWEWQSFFDFHFFFMVWPIGNHLPSSPYTGHFSRETNYMAPICKRWGLQTVPAVGGALSHVSALAAT